MTVSQERLLLKYRQRKLDLLSDLCAAADMQSADWEVLRTQLHQVAGVAGMFGESDLGEMARKLEHLIVFSRDQTEWSQAVQAMIAVLADIEA